MKFGTDINDSLRMNPGDFSDPQTFYNFSKEMAWQPLNGLL